MLEKFENASLTATGVYFVGVNKTKGPHDIDEIDTAIDSVEKHSVDPLDVPEVAGEVVVNIYKRVEQKVHSDERVGQNAEDR